MPKSKDIKKTSLTTLIKSRQCYNRGSGKRNIKKPLKLISTESENDNGRIKEVTKKKSTIQTAVQHIKKYVDENTSPNTKFGDKISLKPQIVSEKVIRPASFIEERNRILCSTEKEGNKHPRRPEITFRGNQLSEQGPSQNDAHASYLELNDEMNSIVVADFYIQDTSSQKSNILETLETRNTQAYTNALTCDERKQNSNNDNLNKVVSTRDASFDNTETHNSQNDEKSSDHCSSIQRNSDDENENTQLIRSFVHRMENMPTREELRDLTNHIKHLKRLLERQIRRDQMPQKPEIFPFETVEALNNFENSNDILYEQVVDYFQFLGGTTLMEAVNFCVKRSVADKVLKYYSVWGEQNNRTFYETKICKAIFDGICVNSSYSRPTEQQFLYAIAEAIRYGKQRQRNSINYPRRNAAHQGYRVLQKQNAQNIFGNTENLENEDDIDDDN